MDKRSKANRTFATVMVLALLALAYLVVAMPAVSQVKMKKDALKAEEKGLYPVNEYGWLTYYMHEVYERYVHAKKAYEKGEYEQAQANLEVMGYFIEVSKKHLPDTLQDGRPFDKEGYIGDIDKLNDHAKDVIENLEKKEWAKTPEGEMDPMMKTCVGCHDAYNIPTDFRIDTKFKVLTHSMHEIYELYRMAGPYLQEGEWDKAKNCFVVIEPYIESIPENIPDENQDGESIDKELFKKAHQELDQFTEDMVKRLETRNWEKGKPLPPPRIVVDNCYACHAKVVKIESPW